LPSDYLIVLSTRFHLPAAFVGQIQANQRHNIEACPLYNYRLTCSAILAAIATVLNVSKPITLKIVWEKAPENKELFPHNPKIPINPTRPILFPPPNFLLLFAECSFLVHSVF
jgi:hypothetical protein